MDEVSNGIPRSSSPNPPHKLLFKVWGKLTVDSEQLQGEKAALSDGKPVLLNPSLHSSMLFIVRL